MPDEASFDREQVLSYINQALAHGIPHAAALGIRARDCGPGWALLELPWADKLVGNPESGVLHGGAVTSLLDQACGMRIFMKRASAPRAPRPPRPRTAPPPPPRPPKRTGRCSPAPSATAWRGTSPSCAPRRTT